MPQSIAANFPRLFEILKEDSPYGILFKVRLPNQ